MICHDRRFIFIHIRRTGGTSLEAALLGRDFDPEKPATPGNEPIPFAQDGKHYKHRKLCDFDRNLVEKYFSFAIVRNPWDRVVSRFFWEKKLGRACVKPFADFHSYVLARKSLPVEEWNITGDFPRKYETQFSYIELDGKIGVDKVIRFERYGDDVQSLGKFGLDHRSLPHLFASDHEPYWRYYTDETREIVEQAYSRDVESLGYTFINN